MVNTVCTLYELVNGDDTETEGDTNIFLLNKATPKRFIVVGIITTIFYTSQFFVDFENCPE